MLTDSIRRQTLRRSLLALALVLAAAAPVLRSSALAQQNGEDAAGPAAEVPAPDAAGPSGAPPPPPSEGGAAAEPAQNQVEGIRFFSLLVSGGWFMVPIALMSLVTVVFSIERGLNLRRDKVMPDELVEKLGELGSPQGGFDPRQAYRLCQQFPSAAANVIKAMLLKIGRPHSEVEHAVAEASQREAERLYSNVRWLNLATAVTPLMGLLGTVWGMIVAFHDTTRLAPGQNKADFLARGIYIALVTTLGGLIVAIPAAMLSHYFESRIIMLFHKVDELLFSLLPQIERYEGRVRFSQRPGDEHSAGAAADLAGPPPVSSAASD